MPAKSAARQNAAGTALSANRSGTPRSALTGASKPRVGSITGKQLDELAHTTHKGKLGHLAGD